MWVFFLGSVFFYFYLKNTKRYKNTLVIIMILVIIAGLIIVLQNMGVIPFLWSEAYRLAYLGFLSGTFGPNKIVLGMTMFISFVFLVGINTENKIQKSKILMYVAIGVSLLCIILSGSRTTYVGVIFFLLYFFFTKTGRFIVFAISGGILFAILVIASPAIMERVTATIENRVTYVIDGPEDINSYEDFSGVYDELGAGRMQLHMKYVNYLIKEPWVIPFGRGFNNRIGVGPSAHNIYLSLISEVGIVGLVLFIRWLLSFMVIIKRKMPGLQLALNGLIIAMMVTLYFGEHLYVYRPLFGILGFFMMICVMLTVPLRKTT
jgi:O-antigen ligase